MLERPKDDEKVSGIMVPGLCGKDRMDFRAVLLAKVAHNC